MEREFHGEWRRLEEEATAFLIAPPTRDALLPDCHAVVLPSFEECRAYTLMVPSLNAPGSPLGVRRVWQRRVDFAKVDGPAIRLKDGRTLRPTIEETEAPLSHEVVQEILDRAASLKAPVLVRQKTVGTDGESFVMSFGSLFVSTRFQWWCEPPAGWEGLQALLHEVVGAVEGALTRR